MSFPFDFATAAAVVALVVWVTFVARYHFSTRGAWRQYAEGRNAMIVSAGLIAVLALNVSARVLRDVPVPPAYPHQGTVALAVYVLIAAAGVHRIILQWRAQRDRS